MRKRVMVHKQEFARWNRMLAAVGTNTEIEKDECHTVFKLTDSPIGPDFKTPWTVTITDEDGAQIVVDSPKCVSITFRGTSALEVFKTILSFALRTLKEQSGGVQRVGSGITLKREIAVDDCCSDDLA